MGFWRKLFRGVGYTLRGLPLLIVVLGAVATYYAASNPAYSAYGIQKGAAWLFVLPLLLWVVGVALTTILKKEAKDEKGKTEDKPKDTEKPKD